MFHLHIIILASHMIRTSLQFWLATCYFSSDLKCVPPSLEVVQFLLQLLRILRPPPDQLLALWAQLLIRLLMSTNVPSYTLQEEEKRLIMNAHRGVGGGRWEGGGPFVQGWALVLSVTQAEVRDKVRGQLLLGGMWVQFSVPLPPVWGGHLSESCVLCLSTMQ